MTRSDALHQTVWREIDAPIAEQKQGSTRALLNGLAEADSYPIGALAARRLDSYLDRAGTTTTPCPTADIATAETIFAALIHAGSVSQDAHTDAAQVGRVADPKKL